MCLVSTSVFELNNPQEASSKPRIRIWDVLFLTVFFLMYGLI